MLITPAPLALSREANQCLDFEELKHLEEKMNEALIDQPEAVKCVAEMIKRIRTGFYDETKPRGVLVFAGPTGVGKTELAKMTAREMGVPLIRFDMSEFSESHKVSRLLGSPPGYVNSNQGGELVNKLKSTPNCVVLFDEIEKAHPDLYKVLLALFDEGRLTDSIGKEVNATQAIFILTTNLGSDEIYRQLQRGERDNLDERLRDLYIQTFSAELYNRFDKVIVFRPLSQPAMGKIVEKYLTHLKDDLAKRKFAITWDQQVITHLSSLNMDKMMGAREMHRKVKESVLPKLVASRIEGKILQTDVKVHVEVVNGQLELVVLDKGKASIGLPQEQVNAAREGSLKKEAMTLVDGIVYLDFINERPLREFKGKSVYRLRTQRGDNSYAEQCIKIIEVSSTGETIYERNEYFSNRRQRFNLLSSDWDDGKWKLATPSKNGRAFFENICTLVHPPQLQEQVFSLVKKIFSELEDDCHLSEKVPFDSLRQYCIEGDKEDLLIKVAALERLLGPLSVKILFNDPTRGSDDGLRSKL